MRACFDSFKTLAQTVCVGYHFAMDDPSPRRFASLVTRLRQAGLRPTRQRLALADLLFSGPDRHVTAELLHEEAIAKGVRVSLATVYNCLHQFTEAGLLRQIAIDAKHGYFDTNISAHHHFFLEDDANLIDIPGETLQVHGMPQAPEGLAVKRVDVIIRVARR